MNADTSSTATLDHRTGATVPGGPASRYHRVARCDDRPPARPNYAARRLVALLAALSSVMVGAWVAGEVAAGVAGRPVSAADAGTSATTVGQGSGSSSRTHVARTGDTLWSIADENRGDVSRDRYIDALVDLNGSTGIVIGQAVHLP